MCDYRLGFGLMNGFIYHIYTRLGTISNYNKIADLLIFKFTRPNSLVFPVCY
jgi:hypothetical protein